MKVTRKQIAQAFTAAKKYLSDTHEDGDGKFEYICWALNHTTRSFSNQELAVVSACREIINARLRRNTTFRDWMEAEYPELRDAIDADYRYNKGRKMQKARSAWLDSLIAEYSK